MQTLVRLGFCERFGPNNEKNKNKKVMVPSEPGKYTSMRKPWE